MTPIFSNNSNNVFIVFDTQNSGTDRSGFVLSYNETDTGELVFVLCGFRVCVVVNNFDTDKFFTISDYPFNLRW